MEIYKIGSRGEIVKRIQRILHLIPDGIYGRLTAEAVTDFQLAHNLKADGVVGPETSAVLFTDDNYIKSKRTIKYIVVHCTATKEGVDLCVADIRKMHKKNGWADIGYHYVVNLEGIVENGRHVDLVGAHVKGYNSNSIGVVYVGGLDKNGKAADTRTTKQKGALIDLLKVLKDFYPEAKIVGHRDLSPDLNHNGIIEPNEWIKECPCFDAKKEYSAL